MNDKTLQSYTRTLHKGEFFYAQIRKGESRLDFTRGKRRQYERLMKEKPGFSRYPENLDEAETLLQDRDKQADGSRKKRTRKRQLEG